MAAKVDTKFSRGFFLTEEALTKIEELVRLRIGEAEDYCQKYDVHRVDDAVISYERAADVVENEENSKRNAVREVSFEATSNLGSVKLNFESGEKSSLQIESGDRDRALLLSSDLKEYLKSEVLIRRFSLLSRIINGRLFYPAFLTLSMLPFFAYSWLKAPHEIDMINATDSQKLDYLVNISSARQDLDIAPVAFFGWMLFLLIIIILVASPRVYPAYTFYWGKEASRYDSAKSLRGKVFWGVIVALAVGLFGSYLSNRF